MGYDHSCGICKSSVEYGEVELHNPNNNQISAPENKLESKLEKDNKITLIKNKTISEILSKYHKHAINLSDVELPENVTSVRPENGYKSEIMRFENGDIYQGYYNTNNEKEGYGSYIKNNGFIFNGLWRADKIGDYSLFIDPKGNYFKGHLLNGVANGEGELMINNKFKYTGNFDNNLPNKKGKLLNYIDNTIYEGDIVNGKKEGKGNIKFTDGTIYDGDFIDDKYEGKGKITFTNGCSYEGEFHNNKIDGKGKYIYSDGKEYNGDFRKGLKHGFGRLSWNNDKYFEGYWINNKQHGKGIFYLNGKTLNVIFRYGKMIMKSSEDVVK